MANDRTGAGMRFFSTDGLVQPRKLGHQISFVFIALTILVLTSSTLTWQEIRRQEQDAVVINLAGRQRMLAQDMARLALEGQLQGMEAVRPVLQADLQRFEQNLAALQHGGPASYGSGEEVQLRHGPSPTVQSQLNRIQENWQPLKGALESVQAALPGSAAAQQAEQDIKSITPGIIEQLDRLVQQYELESGQSTARLRNIQAAFNLGALLLLGVGVWIMRQSLLQPLGQLGQAARRLGQGDLNTRVPQPGPPEIATLAEILEQMRQNLQRSQAELQAWSSTLEKRVQQRTQELEALDQVSREISSRLELQAVLQSVTEHSNKLLGGEVAILCLLDEGDTALQVKAFDGPIDSILQRQAQSMDGQVAEIMECPVATLCSQNTCARTCGIMAPEYKRSHIATALRVGDRTLGALCVGNSRPGAFPPEAPPLLTRLSNSAAIALENARLYGQAERLAAIEERQQIAAEIHDGLVQTLSCLGQTLDQVRERCAAAGMATPALEDLEHARQRLGEAIQEARQVIDHLLEASAEPHSFQEILNILAQELSTSSATPITWHDRTRAPVVLRTLETEQALLVAREALLNAINYSQAQAITLSLEAVEDPEQPQISLRVSDDGCGFDQEHLPQDGRQHFGLRIMQARASHMHAQLAINSQPGAGTQVQLTWTPEIEGKEHAALPHPVSG